MDVVVGAAVGRVPICVRLLMLRAFADDALSLLLLLLLLLVVEDGVPTCVHVGVCFLLFAVLFFHLVPTLLVLRLDTLSRRRSSRRGLEASPEGDYQTPAR